MNNHSAESFFPLYDRGDVEAARAWLTESETVKQSGETGYRAHPLLVACVKQHRGHCYRKPHLRVAELFLPPGVRTFRDALLAGQVQGVARALRTDAALVHAEFTGGGRGIAQAIHHIGSVSMAEVLLEAGADVHARTSVHEGDTPLGMALRFGTLETVSFLLANGADPNRGLSTNIPSEHLSQAIELLQNHDWAINGQDAARPRSTMLHHDANHGHGKRICIWLSHGADPTVCDERGQTALHVLAARGKGAAAIRALVAAGADPGQPDDAGRTPLDLARGAPYQAAYEALRALSSPS